MRVVRGRADDPDADREATRVLVSETAETREPALRVWHPHRQLAFGRRDTSRDGYELALEAARDHGFPPYERRVGGRAVAYTGTTLSFLRVEPIDDPRGGIEDRYDRAVDDVRSALIAVGVDAERGEPPASFCPGDHSLSATGKIVGIAQHVRRDVASVAGVILVSDRTEIATVLEDVYGALDVPFDPTSVGSVAAAGGNVERLQDAVETALAGDRDPRIERIGTARRDRTP